MKLIDKDTLVSEIEKLTKTYSELPTRNPYEDGLKDGRLIGYKDALYKINTLEVKEVDLDKEYKEYVEEDIVYNKLVNGIVGKAIAKHFYELGLKTNQNIIKIGETKIYLDDDGGEPPYDGKQWLDLSCTEYEIPKDRFNDGDDVEILIRKI